MCSRRGFYPHLEYIGIDGDLLMGALKSSTKNRHVFRIGPASAMVGRTMSNHASCGVANLRLVMSKRGIRMLGLY